MKCQPTFEHTKEWSQRIREGLRRQVESLVDIVFEVAVDAVAEPL